MSGRCGPPGENFKYVNAGLTSSIQLVTINAIKNKTMQGDSLGNLNYYYLIKFNWATCCTWPALIDLLRRSKCNCKFIITFLASAKDFETITTM
jgi:hypothetical protein